MDANRRPGSILIAALSVLSVFYFVGGVVLGAAASRRGTPFGHETPIEWSRIPSEFARTSWSEVQPFFPWLLAPTLALMVALTLVLALSPRFLLGRSWLQYAAVALIFLSVPAALMGAISVVFMILNATLLPSGLDGEWLNEFHPVMEAFFLAFLACSISFVRAPKDC
ncbi:MAG TPA: hypothetical protein VF756_06665 [Thermoanaerobaculia bacterium]